MQHHIQGCYRDWDVDGEGPTLGAALDAIAADCERDAASLDKTATELLKRRRIDDGGH
jgi:hypothetical protein